MTPDQITRLRQNIKEILKLESQLEGVRLPTVVKLAKQVLALLPCETCGGTGRKPRAKGAMHCPLRLCICEDANCGKCDHYIPQDPCPDCQSCIRCGGTNGTHKQVDDPQAGNSHMLTKMPCPNDMRSFESRMKKSLDKTP